MTFEELYKSLEYAMGPWAIQDECKQMFLGSDGKSLSHIADGVHMRNPIFQRLLLEEAAENDIRDGAAPDSQTVDPAKLLGNAKTLEEAEDIILTATPENFFVSLDSEIPVDVPIAKLALDSLVSIELKNWMVRTFRVPLQASELAGALSLTALDKLLALGSKCIKDAIRTESSEDGSPHKKSQQDSPEVIPQNNKYQKR
ncbi:putative Polyketide synthase [Seiridium cardinale]